MLGFGFDEVSIMTIFYPHETVSVSSLGYSSSVGPISKPSHPSLPILFIGFRVNYG